MDLLLRPSGSFWWNRFFGSGSLKVGRDCSKRRGGLGGFRRFGNRAGDERLTVFGPVTGGGTVCLFIRVRSGRAFRLVFGGGTFFDDKAGTRNRGDGGSGGRRAAPSIRSFRGHGGRPGARLLLFGTARVRLRGVRWRNGSAGSLLGAREQRTNRELRIVFGAGVVRVRQNRSSLSEGSG